MPRNPSPNTPVLEDIIDHVDLDQLLQGCRQKDRASQQRLYSQFYNYAMSVARRYVNNLETAEEICNDTFFKVFTKIELYSGAMPFRYWLRRILINTAIDRLRSGMNTPALVELQSWQDPEWDSGIIEELTHEQIIGMLDQLPPAYRMAFNLFVVDGFTHEEIAEVLQISVGASKSNLSRARQHLRKLLPNDFELSR